VSPLFALRRLANRPAIRRLTNVFGVRGLLRRLYRQASGASLEHAVARHYTVAGFRAVFEFAAESERSTVETQIIDERPVLKSLLTALHPGNTVFDVGAHVGVYTLFLGKKVGPAGRVIAFEPAPENLPALRRNIARNGLKNVIVVPLALGEAAGTGRLVGRSVFGTLTAGAKDGPSRVVSIASGDALAAASGWAVPCAIKIDVEGYEREVLRGMARTLSHPACRWICCEIHLSILGPAADLLSFIKILEAHGFRRFERLPCYEGVSLHLIGQK
jgi:FkbM family methyltransferase